MSVAAGDLTSTCPGCGKEVPDLDGFGIQAHTQPEYADGCGYCSHPTECDGWCRVCRRPLPIIFWGPWTCSHYGAVEYWYVAGGTFRCQQCGATADEIKQTEPPE